MTTEVLREDGAAPAQSLAELMNAMGRAAAAAAQVLARASTAQKNKALKAAAEALRRRRSELLAVNERDLEAAGKAQVTKAMLDRLRLNDERIEAMAVGLEAVA